MLTILGSFILILQRLLFIPILLFIIQTLISSSVTSKCPYEQALCKGTRPLNNKNIICNKVLDLGFLLMEISIKNYILLHKLY
jgi:hypothetical protein